MKALILAAAALSLFAAPSFAAPVRIGDGGGHLVGVAPSNPGNPGDPGNPGPGDDGACTVLCDLPGNPGPKSDNPTSSTNPANPNGVANAPFKLCGDRLSQLRHVGAGELATLAGEQVKIVPVCEGHSSSLTKMQVSLLDRGNVAGLTPAIAANPALISKLAHRNYKANDVIGVVVNGAAGVLYVHHQ